MVRGRTKERPSWTEGTVSSLWATSKKVWREYDVVLIHWTVILYDRPPSTFSSSTTKTLVNIFSKKRDFSDLLGVRRKDSTAVFESLRDTDSPFSTLPSEKRKTFPIVSTFHLFRPQGLL